MAFALLASAVAAAATRVWFAAVVLLLTAVVVMPFRRIDVRVDRRELRVTYAGPIRLRHTFRRDEIESARVLDDVVAWKWGWGYRGSRRLMKKAALVIRRGPAVELDLADGTTFIVTVDRPDGAVAALGY